MSLNTCSSCHWWNLSDSIFSGECLRQRTIHGVRPKYPFYSSCKNHRNKKPVKHSYPKTLVCANCGKYSDWKVSATTRRGTTVICSNCHETARVPKELHEPAVQRKQARKKGRVKRERVHSK